MQRKPWLGLTGAIEIHKNAPTWSLQGDLTAELTRNQFSFSSDQLRLEGSLTGRISAVGSLPKPDLSAALNGENIPDGARLLAVVDAFDAMTSDRPYRKALSAEQAYAEILNESEKQFDPRIVQAMERCWDAGIIHHILDNSGRTSLT